MAVRIFPGAPSYLTVRQINFQGRSNSVPLSNRTVTPPPPYVAPRENIIIRFDAPSNNLGTTPLTLEDNFQTEREFRTPPPIVPIDGIMSPPPTIERINILPPSCVSTSELDYPQSSTPMRNLDPPRDTTETIGVEERSTEDQNIITEGPFLLDPRIALLNYH